MWMLMWMLFWIRIFLMMMISPWILLVAPVSKKFEKIISPLVDFMKNRTWQFLKSREIFPRQHNQQWELFPHQHNQLYDIEVYLTWTGPYPFKRSTKKCTICELHCCRTKRNSSKYWIFLRRAILFAVLVPNTEVYQSSIEKLPWT